MSDLPVVSDAASAQAVDAEAAAVQKGKRVTLKEIENAIAERHHFVLADALYKVGALKAPVDKHPSAVMSICVLVMKNSYVIIGKSASADPKNFNSDLGRKLAYDDAVKQLWPLMGFELRSKLNEID